MHARRKPGPRATRAKNKESIPGPSAIGRARIADKHIDRWVILTFFGKTFSQTSARWPTCRLACDPIRAEFYRDQRKNGDRVYARMYPRSRIYMYISLSSAADAVTRESIDETIEGT